jgi:hypothetical protein
VKRTSLIVALPVLMAASVLIVSTNAAVKRSTVACGPAPHKLAGKPALPTKFPTPAKVSYTGSKKAGPTTIVSGFYSSGNLTAIHHAYSKALKAAGYTITHEEQDEADSEVNFSGFNKTGQVKLAKRCTSRILITIPIRPA